MKREEIVELIGRPISDAEWLEAHRRLKVSARYSNANAVLDCCVAGLGVEATIEDAAAELVARSQQ